VLSIPASPVPAATGPPIPLLPLPLPSGTQAAAANAAQATSVRRWLVTAIVPATVGIAAVARPATRAQPETARRHCVTNLLRFEGRARAREDRRPARILRWRNPLLPINVRPHHV